MKAPTKAMRRIPPQTKKRSHIYATLIYRAHKEVNPTGMKRPEFLTRKHSFPKPVLLSLVGLEAYRLSKTNRLQVLTLQEINAAFAHIQQKIHSSGAA